MLVSYFAGALIAPVRRSHLALRKKDFNTALELNEIEINERFALLMRRIQNKEKKDLMKNLTSSSNSPVGGSGTSRIGNEEECKLACKHIREKSDNQKCFDDCIKGNS